MTTRSFQGAVAIVTQSGAMGACMLTGFQESGSGISSLVSLGNEVDVDFAECVEYFLDDPHTRVICGYLESVRNGKRLKRAARRALELGKPIVLLKGGKTEEGARAARSHTAAITTSSDVFDAFAAQYGVQVLGSMDEFIEIADFLARTKPIQGNGVGILSFLGRTGRAGRRLKHGRRSQASRPRRENARKARCRAARLRAQGQSGGPRIPNGQPAREPAAQNRRGSGGIG